MSEGGSDRRDGGGGPGAADPGELLRALRQDYDGAPLDEGAAAADPFEQFGEWFGDALAIDLRLANGMALATVGLDGRPAVRTVLLKGWDARGFVFYTSYASRKAREIEAGAGGRVALLFWWAPLERQIRVEGRAARVPAAESDAYFATRPRASNLSAMASPQSEPVAGRGWLEARVRELEAEWEGRELVRPAGWGGYRVEPDRFEFWQGRPDRLHDRLRYDRQPDGWRVERLGP